MKRIRQQFTEGWKFHLGEIPVLHPVKSGMTGGLTSSSEVEEGEWLKIAYFDECEILEPEDGEWKDAAIPHDWIVEGAYRNDHGEVKHHRSHGYLDSGVGFYRKIFRIPKEWEGRRIGLEFEGIFRKSTIWVNGYEVMNHESVVMAKKEQMLFSCGWMPENMKAGGMKALGSTGRSGWKSWNRSI